MDAFDPDEFWVSGPLIGLVLTDGVTESGSFPLGAMLRLSYARADGSVGTFVPLFTDLDLAERFLASHGAEGDGYHPFQSATLAATARLLEAVERHGITEFAFDPAPGRTRIVPLANLLLAIRRRLAQGQ